MLLDNESLFCDSQAITSGTIYSTNTVKFGSGEVSWVPVIIQVVKDFVSLEKLNVKVQTSANESFSSPTDLVESTLALADLKAGKKFPINYLPKGNLGFMRLCFTVTGTETTGAITAGVTASVETD